MTRRTLWNVVVLSVLVFFAVVAATRRAATHFALWPSATIGYHPGEMAPDFALPSLASATIHLSDFRGHVVVLNFWATWCTPCRVEMPWLAAFDRQYRVQGMRIIGVNLDDTGTSRDTIAGFARERGIAYPVLLGNNAVADAYGGIRFMPQTFFIATDGKILSSTYGVTTREEFEANIKGALATIRR